VWLPLFWVLIVIAFFSAIVATAIGTLMALALVRHRFRGQGATNLLIFLPMATPEIVMGSSLLTLFLNYSVPLGFTTILIAHIMFNISFVVVTVRARLAGKDRHLEEAAADLFANPWTTFYKVTLPLIWPGILAGFLLAAKDPPAGPVEGSPPRRPEGEPSSLAHHARRADAHLELGRLFAAERRPADAEDAFRSAFGVYQALQGKYADKPEHREGLAAALGRGALTLKDAGRYQDAATVCRWESGKRIPTLTTWERIGAAFQMPVPSLLSPVRVVIEGIAGQAAAQ
jgi:hypothetical protein